MKKPRIIRFKVNNFLRNSAFFLIIAGFFIFSIQPVEAAKVIRIGETKEDDDIIKIEGKIGINTSSPYSLLEIASSTKYEGLRIISAASYTPFVIRNSANNADLFRIDQQGNITATGGVFGSNTDNYWKLNGSTIYASSTSWNVGIGTTNPATKLEVNGDIMVANTSKIGFRYTNSDNNFYNYIAYPAGGPFTIAGGLWTSTPTQEAISFKTKGVAAAMSILNNGNVGIGTTNPGVKLDVKGRGQFDTSNTYTSYNWGGSALQTNSLEILDKVGGNTSDGIYPTLIFHDYGNGGAQFTMEGLTEILHLASGGASSAGTMQTGSTYFSKLKIWGGLDVTGSSNLAISSGNVGIGTSLPSSVPGLHVVSGTGYSIYAGSKKIGQVASPTDSADASNKGYVDAAIPGFFSSPDLSLTQYNQYYYMQFGSITIPSGQIRYAGSWVVALYGFEIPSDYDKLGYLKINIRRDASNNASYSASIANFGSKKVDPIYITTDDGVNYKLYIKVETKTSYSGYYKFKLIQQTQDPLVLASGTHITTDTAPSGTKYTWTATETSATFTGITNYVPKFNSAGSLTNSIIFDNGANVGIGTTNPGGKIEVANGSGRTIFLGNSTGLGDLMFFYGLNGANLSLNSVTPAAGNLITDIGINYAVNGSNGNGFYAINGAKKAPVIRLNAEDGSIALIGENGTGVNYRSVSNTPSLFIQGSGNVGIGTTNPETRLSLQNSTYRQLSLKGGSGDQTLNLGSVESSVGSYIYNNAYYSSSNTYLPSKTSASGMQMRNDGSIDFLTNTGLTIGTAYTPTSRIKILSNGNVGIGTTNPLAKLTIRHAQNNVVSGSFAVPHLKLENSATTDFTGFTGISYGLSTLDNYGWTSGALRTEAGASPAAFIWRFHSNSTVGSELVRIKSDGSVGIGTTNPTASLEVLSGGTYSILAGSKRIGNVASPVASTDAVNRSYVDTNFAPIGGGASLWATSSTGMYNVGLGNVGIGTTNPDAKLDIFATATTANVFGLKVNAAVDFGDYSYSEYGGHFVANGTDVDASYGVYGVSNPVGYNSASYGVYGKGIDVGVYGDNLDGGYGVYGYSTGVGVFGYSYSQQAIFAQSGTGFGIYSSAPKNYFSGNVGIGTASPSQKLDVSGVITASTGFRVNNGATSGQYLRGNGTNFVSSAIQASDVPTLNQNTSGYASLLNYEDNRTILPSELSANRMKFGFTSYSNNNSSPYADFLHFRSYQDSSGGSDNLLVINKTGLGMRLYQQAWGSATAYSTFKDVLLSDNSPTVNYLTRYTGVGNNVSVGKSIIYDNGSNTGVGTNNPGYKLEVVGEVGSIGVNKGFRVGSTSGDNTNSAPWYGLGQSTQNLWSGQSWGSVQLAGYAGLNFKTASGSMVITGDTGYVGIGTTNPSRKLTVYGTHDNTSMRLHAETGQSGVNQNSILSLWASEPSMSYAGAGIGENVNSYPSWGVVNSARMGALIRFYYGSTIIERMSTSGSRTESMIINSNGDVGIGTTNPGYKLDVIGSVGAQSFTYNSDARLKKNIKTIKNPLGKILSLRGVTFNWKDSGDASVGLIAQEVEKVFPELVNGNDIKGVEYGNLVAPLIEAVKEQQRMIDKLEARIDILEKKSNTK